MPVQSKFFPFYAQLRALNLYKAFTSPPLKPSIGLQNHTVSCQTQTHNYLTQVSNMRIDAIVPFVALLSSTVLAATIPGPQPTATGNAIGTAAAPNALASPVDDDPIDVNVPLSVQNCEMACKSKFQVCSIGIFPGKKDY